MDGSLGDAGKLTSQTAFNFVPGFIYTLQFDIAGNQRNAENESVAVQVDAGGLFSESFSLNQSDPFQTVTRTFSVGSPSSANLSFEGAGTDNIGMLLDNVSLTYEARATPDASSTAMILGFGLFATFAASTRSRRSTNVAA